MSDVLLIEDENRVRTLTLNRPQQMNALNDELIETLQQAFYAASEDSSVRVVVVTGAEGAFCAGLDLQAQMQKGISFDPADDLGWVGRQALAVLQCQKPVIAAINGPAVGAGLGLALAADLRYLAQESYVMAGYVRRALSPDAGVSYFLPRLISPTHAAEIMLTGRRVSANECERLNLVNALFPASQLMERVHTIAEELAKGPPIALRLTRQLLQRSYEQDLITHLRDEWNTIQQSAFTADVAEAMMAFLEKRDPAFEGR